MIVVRERPARSLTYWCVMRIFPSGPCTSCFLVIVFFKLNTTFVCLQFTRHLNCVPNKNGAWQRDYSVQKTHMRVSHIQLARKHWNFQSLMLLSTFLVGGIFKTSIRNWCSWITFWLSDFQSRRRKEFFTLPFWMNLLIATTQTCNWDRACYLFKVAAK